MIIPKIIENNAKLQKKKKGLMPFTLKINLSLPTKPINQSIFMRLKSLNLFNLGCLTYKIFGKYSDTHSIG